MGLCERGQHPAQAQAPQTSGIPKQTPVLGSQAPGRQRLSPEPGLQGPSGPEAQGGGGARPHSLVYLSPVAEHLPVSSTGHVLLGKLEKTGCHLGSGPYPMLGSRRQVDFRMILEGGGWGGGKARRGRAHEQ